MKELQYLNTFFLNYKWRLLLGLLVTIIAACFKLYVPKIVGDIFNIAEQFIKGDINDIALVKKSLLTKMALIVATAIAAALFTFIMRQTIIVVSRNIEYDLKNVIFKQYEVLSLNFYKQNRTGDLMNRISEDVGKVRMYTGPSIMYSASTIAFSIITISYMFYIAPVLTLYAIIPLPILSISIYKLSIAIHKRSTVVQEYLSKLTVFTQESFSGIRVVKAYGIEEDITSDFEKTADISKQKNINLTKVQALFFPLMILLIGLSNILVVYIGGNQYINNKIDFGTIVEFLLYVNMLTWPVAIVGWVSSMVQQAEASQKRINAFLKEEPQIKNTIATPTPISGKIAFKDVYFTYPDTKITALKGVSFSIEPNKTLAIIGNTGSGKSTILELIARLYDIDKGTYYVDNQIAKNVNLNSLRASIGYVPQDAFLFSDSIKNNIMFGYKQATDEEVFAAAKNAAVHLNIEQFTQGYNTILGERGITLSGGQKQRISIARALIKNPKILLLDDCLSAVDTETEEKILQNLARIPNTTTVIVSHRVSSVKNANNILVLKEGEIIQQGSHNELINQKGYYQELYHKQLNEKEN